MLRARCALEHGAAQRSLHDGEVQRLGNRRIRNVALQHGQHHLQAGFAGNLGGQGHAGAGTGLQTLAYGGFFGDPEIE